jgi:hypothetical protein
LSCRTQFVKVSLTDDDRAGLPQRDVDRRVMRGDVAFPDARRRRGWCAGDVDQSLIGSGREGAAITPGCGLAASALVAVPHQP